MSKLIRFDEERWVRLDLDQGAIAEKGHLLLAACEDAIAQDARLAEALTPLMTYAKAGITGQITEPRTWEQDPLRFEFGERLLPEPVRAAYGKYAFETHGLTRDVPHIVHEAGLAYIRAE
jgi:hypothetical protein